MDTHKRLRKRTFLPGWYINKNKRKGDRNGGNEHIVGLFFTLKIHTAPTALGGRKKGNKMGEEKKGKQRSSTIGRPGEGGRRYH